MKRAVCIAIVLIAVAILVRDAAMGRRSVFQDLYSVDDLDRELQRQAIWGNAQEIRALLRRGAQLNIRRKRELSAGIGLLTNGKSMAFFTCLKDATILHFAVYQGNKGIVELLLNEGADVSVRGDQGMTPLHLLLAREMHGKYLRDSVRNGGQNSFEAMAMLLIEHAGDMNMPDDTGEIPLHKALNMRNDKYLPQFRSAQIACAVGIAQHMIRKGADVNAKNDLGLTPFHYAVQGYPMELVGFMIAKGADVNVQCPEGWSPLHCAVSAKGGQVVDLLIQSGANINARLKDGTTPLDLAEANGYKEIAASLRKYGAKPGNQLRG